MKHWRQRLGGTVSRVLLGLFFITAGALHFIFPQAYMQVMPPWLGWHAALVAISGAAEFAGGAAMLLPRWPALRRLAGWGLLALCVAVLPANVQMLQDALAAAKPAWLILLLVVRLPLQALLMAWIWQVSRTRDAGARYISVGRHN